MAGNRRRWSTIWGLTARFRRVSRKEGELVRVGLREHAEEAGVLGMLQLETAENEIGLFRLRARPLLQQGAAAGQVERARL